MAAHRFPQRLHRNEEGRRQDLKEMFYANELITTLAPYQLYLQNNSQYNASRKS